MKKNWWKVLCVVLILFSLVAGLLIPVPDLPIVHQSIRNLFFHVGMWFAMLVIFTISFIYSIRYLSGFRTDNDIVAQEASKVGVFFGILGITTGMMVGKMYGQQFITKTVEMFLQRITIGDSGHQ